MNNIENLFSGFSKDKIASAMRKAEALANNEEIKKAFSGASKNELIGLFERLDSKNKDEVMNAILRSDSKGISELLKKIKR